MIKTIKIMTIEETKKAIEVMQEYVDGKEIEYCNKDDDKWYDATSPCWSWDVTDYRVKPEAKVRPYTYEEFIKAFKQHGCILDIVASKDGDKGGYIPVSISEDYILFWDDDKVTYADLADGYKWVDDNSPCGVVE